jgi:hypothetical protein
MSEKTQVRSLDLPQQTRRTKEAEEYEKRTPDTDGRVKTHKRQVSGRLETIDLASEQIVREKSGFRDVVSVASNYHRGG